MVKSYKSLAPLLIKCMAPLGASTPNDCHHWIYLEILRGNLVSHFVYPSILGVIMSRGPTAPNECHQLRSHCFVDNKRPWGLGGQLQMDVAVVFPVKF